MKSKLFKILVIICVLVAVAIIIALKQYNKPHEDIRNMRPELEIGSAELTKEFEADENIATQLYSDKIIQVTGIVSDVQVKNGSAVVTISDEGSKLNTVCYMEPEENINALKLKTGQQLSIKGKCSGFLLDVVMIRCVLINDKDE